MKSLSKADAKLLDAHRHDSGDAVLWGRDLRAWLRGNQIDSKTKTAIFSNNINIPEIIRLADLFHPYYKSVCGGIGTNFTFDLEVPAIQAVMKLTAVDGHPVAKHSDDEGKGMCECPDYDRYLRTEVDRFLTWNQKGTKK